MTEIDDQVCDAGEWFPLRVALKDAVTAQPINLLGVAVTCLLQRRVAPGETPPAPVTANDWEPGAEVAGVVSEGVLWLSPTNLATAGSYDCRLEATKTPAAKPWPQRASFRLVAR